MTTPRNVQDYEAQAREVWASCLHDGDSPSHEPIAAALRDAERAALERAARTVRECMTEGDTVLEVEAAIRALIAPAPESPPGPDYDPITAPIPEGDMNGPHGPLPDLFEGHSDAQLKPPHWRIGRHYGIHVYCGDTPIATFHAVEDAKAAVRAYNASLDRCAPARGRDARGSTGRRPARHDPGRGSGVQPRIRGRHLTGLFEEGAMPVLTVKLDGDGAWPDLATKKVHHVTGRFEVSGLPGGMDSGKPSVAFRIDLEDGSVVLAETSMRLFLTAADLLKAKFGDPR